jgi:ATP-binding cassette subfamily B protein
MDADNIIVLDDGKIVGQGKHDELLKTCNVYQEIVYSQMDKDEIEKTISLSKEFSMEGGIK